MATLVDESSQAKYVVNKIQRISQNSRGLVTYQDFDVLFRARESKQDCVVTKFPQAVWLYIFDSMAGRKARLREKWRNQASLAVLKGLNSRENDPTNWTRISPRSETVYEARSKGLRVKRTQFPLLSAAALTIHKSQGSIYDKVLLDIRGQPRLNRNALYVACSGARHADNLYIIANSFPVPDPMPPSKCSLS
ncbi:hypothetical protein [Parasitella parasitica]|uniref:UvrD-like helicase C-terminal domain-containing protein n=1 Tax=Parasitella parasitica TaxID=35722 RepID=A0A0B7N5F6_9FUNG|nr:hypothetical protein [Parasitella parasitica]